MQYFLIKMIHSFIFTTTILHHSTVFMWPLQHISLHYLKTISSQQPISLHYQNLYTNTYDPHIYTFNNIKWKKKKSNFYLRTVTRFRGVEKKGFWSKPKSQQDYNNWSKSNPSPLILTFSLSLLVYCFCLPHYKIQQFHCNLSKFKPLESIEMGVLILTLLMSVQRRLKSLKSYYYIQRNG